MKQTINETKHKYKIKVMYFMPDGTYYSSGSYYTSLYYMVDVFEEFRIMLIDGHRPGLNHGHDSYTALLDCSEHPNGYPALFYNQA